MVARQWIRKRRWGLVLGLLATLAGCGLFAAGFLDRFYLYGLDLHFRHLGRLEADPRIVLIDINDYALSEVGAWPWPRRRYAELIQSLNELGAEAIVLDLILSERTNPRYEGAPGPMDSDEVEDGGAPGDRSNDLWINDDEELAEAIEVAGNVYTAMYFQVAPPNVDPAALVNRALALIRADPNITHDRFAATLAAPAPWSGGAFYYEICLANALADDFGLDGTALANRLEGKGDMRREIVERHLPAAKRLAAGRAVSRFLHEHPDGTPEAFLQSIGAARPIDAVTRDGHDLLSAFDAEKAIQALMATCADVPPGLGGHIGHAFNLTLPLPKFAAAARGVGFVTFEREKSRGVVREVPLVVEREGKLLPQLGFQAATDELGADRSAVSYERGRLVLGSGSSARRLPLDASGATLIHWQVPPQPDRWQDSFDHVPVTRALEIPLNRTSIRENQAQLGIAWGALVETRHADTRAEYAAYERLVNERNRLRRAALRPSAVNAITNVERMAHLDEEIERFEADALVWLERAWSLWRNASPTTTEEQNEREKIRKHYDQFGTGGLPAEIAAKSKTLEERNQTLIRELAPRVQGKLCVVGYTASAVADLVTTPVYSSMPGVMAHANIINMILQDRPAILAPRWVNVMLILAAGLVITTITCARGPLASLTGVLVWMGLLLAFGGLVFRESTYHFASLPAVVIVASAWAAVTIYRQFIEEKARRQIQVALGQYTSHAVAARIADRVDATSLSPHAAEVTCFFSDLAGFTQLSERLGAAQTRQLLNPYLGAVSRVLIEHNGLVNKFMGDGIFAFFNAPVWPCSGHAEAGCASALAAFDAVKRLNRTEPAAGSHDGGSLTMRIGLSTGEAFVGDYGSDTKLDYTCIGDTVNLGSRLESANKAFGTRILADQATQLGAGRRFMFRSLGLVLLEGKSAAVPVHELVGLEGEVDEAVRAYIRRFEEAVASFQACQWESCLRLLAECQRLRPQDRACQCYIRETQILHTSPAAATWSGALRLAAYQP